MTSAAMSAFAAVTAPAAMSAESAVLAEAAMFPEAAMGKAYTVLALALGVATFIPEFRSLHNLGNVATQSAALGILAGFVLATTLLTVSWLSDTSDAEAWAHAVPSPMLAAASFEPS